MKDIYLYNTLTKKKELFKPIEAGKVQMYHCGPTVYDYQHIGNMYSSLFADFLRRSFEYLGYDVTQIMNFTDVGHLSGDNEGDADTGEDRLEKGAKKFEKNVWQVAEEFTQQFLKDVRKLNVREPYARPKATEFIRQIIELNTQLVQFGHAYETEEALYFDVATFPSYTELSGQDLDEKISGVRLDVNPDPQKKNSADFALWFKRVGRFTDHSMHWDSPWGDGFPGWHIECSAMSKYYLGPHFDIHTGGIEHIPVHHTNEIAQSESANREKFVNYWMHHQLILVDGVKMSKSLGNVYLISDLEAKGYDPLAYRLLVLQSKYREQLNFTIDSLTAAQNSLISIRKQIRELLTSFPQSHFRIPNEGGFPQSKNFYQEEFENALADDLNTAVAVSVFFKVLRDKQLDPETKYRMILHLDKVLGLKLDQIKPIKETKELKELKKKWQEARERRDWETADNLRDKIQVMENNL